MSGLNNAFYGKDIHVRWLNGTDCYQTAVNLRLWTVHERTQSTPVMDAIKRLAHVTVISSKH